LTLLCADALAFTPVISERHREILVGALREVAAGKTTEDSEAEWFEQMLNAEMRTTAPYTGGESLV